MSSDAATLSRPHAPVRNRIAVALVASLSFASCAAVAEVRGDNLLGVVKETLDSNPEIEAQLEAFYAANEDSREVFGGYLPSVDVSTAVGQANREFDHRSDYSRNYAELSLTQMLFDGFRVRNRLAKSEHTSRVRYYELLGGAEGKALEASEAYLSVLRHRELVKLAQNNVTNHLRVQAHVEERAGSGVGNRADLYQIEGRLSLARTNLMTEIANLQSVTARFQRLVGRAPAGSMEPFETPAGRLPANLESVMKRVFANNPALYAAFENTQVAEAALRESKASRYPTFELGMRQGLYKNYSGFDSGSDPKSYGSENVVELRAKFNLYRGGSDRAAERAAYRRLNQSDSLRDKACVDLRQTATIAYTDVLNYSQRRASLVMHRDASANVVAAYREQFDIGRRSLLDVLDSENEAFQSERAYANGMYDLQIAKVQTLHSMGQLLQTLSLDKEQIPALEDLHRGEVFPTTSRYCAAIGDAQLNIDHYLQPAKQVETIELSGDALFETDSARLKEGSVVRLKHLVEQLRQQSGEFKAVSIVGHTDSTGSAERNRELSLARAEAVRDLLIGNGVARGVISVSGVGAEQPIASNDTPHGRADNRRVALQVRSVK